MHTGIDIAAAAGASIVAIARGRVLHVGHLWVSGKGYGRGAHAVVLQHARNLFSVYSHCSEALVVPGMCVDAGQAIARVGREGFARDIDHLHLEVLFDAQANGNLFYSKLWSVPFFSPCALYRDFAALSSFGAS